MRHTTHVNEKQSRRLFHMHRTLLQLSCIYMSHGTHTNESCNTHKRATAPDTISLPLQHAPQTSLSNCTWMCHGTRTNTSCNTHKRVTAPDTISSPPPYAPQTAHKWVTAHVRISYATRISESRHLTQSHRLLHMHRTLLRKLLLYKRALYILLHAPRMLLFLPRNLQSQSMTHSHMCHVTIARQPLTRINSWAQWRIAPVPAANSSKSARRNPNLLKFTVEHKGRVDFRKFLTESLKSQLIEFLVTQLDTQFTVGNTCRADFGKKTQLPRLVNPPPLYCREYVWSWLYERFWILKKFYLPCLLDISRHFIVEYNCRADFLRNSEFSRSITYRAFSTSAGKLL